MDTASFSKVLLDVYRLARTLPMQQFQRAALEAVNTRFDFDSAWWGVASKPVGADLEIHSSLPYRLPLSYCQLWYDIRHDDTLADATLAAPGTTSNFGKKQLYARPGLASLMARFGIQGALCTVTTLTDVNVMTFLSLYRVEGKPPFTESERRHMEWLMPHLTAAMHSNWMLHLERMHSNLHASGRPSLAVVDSRGMLYVADQSITEMIRLDWPNWSGPVLPATLVRHVVAGTTYQSARMAVRFHAVGDVWLMDIRVGHEGKRLSPRESDIAMRFSEGASYKEIAQTLGASPATVRHHLREVYKKLGVSDKAELARRLQRHSTEHLNLDAPHTLEALPGASVSFDGLMGGFKSEVQHPQVQ